ncbi:type II toxin-antitoxin system MqsR family toxin [Chrysiogenes arsenatis]|uniref:type II toxin-antitoxin system MqsR family toxin n=1 Tax=Chrysiogenes arsenatis TaxID=309797 RepID=UPI0003F99ACE|nr:type II toxin-antitoxin system MqsR family toxin [Chrysiogenes arsenatis]
MEKQSPHYCLTKVKSLITARKVRTTHSARMGAVELGLDFEAMLSVIASLKMTDFYKSMTSYSDHTVWQDVYRPKTFAGDIYLKLTVVEDVLIISFKEL